MAEETSAWLTPSRLFALTQVLVLNGVVLYGVYGLGWSWGTALVLYWCETLMGTFFIALRMLVHRRLTRKKGYFRPQLGITVNDEPYKRFVPEFVTGSLAFNLAHGLFLFLVLGVMTRGEPGAAVQLGSLEKGAAATALILAGSFFVDLQGIRDKPFSWIRGLAQHSMGRTVVVQIVIVLGFAGVMFFNKKQAPFVIFAVYKILFDLGWLGSGKTPEEAPGWAVRAASLSRKGGKRFAEEYRKDRKKEDRLLEQDEQTMPAKHR